MSRLPNMAGVPASQAEMLKLILEHAQTPEDLNDHPWLKGRIVRDAMGRNPSLQRLEPGERLLAVIEGFSCR